MDLETKYLLLSLVPLVTFVVVGLACGVILHFLGYT